MKLGVTYNIWNGFEFFQQSVKNIRPVADYISVVYQDISTCKEASPINTSALLKDMQDNGLVDGVQFYDTNEKLKVVRPHLVMLDKINIGLEMCRAAGCTHHLIVDADEFYIQEQIEWAKKFVEDNDLDGSVCHILSSVKEPVFRIRTKPDADVIAWYVGFIYKIRNRIKYEVDALPDVKIDPRRQMTSPKFHVFDIDQIAMYHMTYCRIDLISKFKNHTIAGHKTVEQRQELSERIMNARVDGEFNAVQSVEEVDDIFHLSAWRDNYEALLAKYGKDDA